MNNKSSSLALYVHIPYCLHKCPYCDFNSYGLDTIEMDEAAYTESVCKELQFYLSKPELKASSISSIFFGGGTPSLFKAESIAKILKSISKLVDIRPDCEVTLESNPGTVLEKLGSEKLKGFRESGVNRVSFGGQSLNQSKLSKIGRIHSIDDTYSSLENAKAAGFSNINLDLMFGVEGDSLESWSQEVESVLSLSIPHLSLYCLTIEPGTVFGKRTKKGANFQSDEEIQAKQFIKNQQRLAAANYTHYEISNFAKVGFECQHNLNYWNVGSYLGIGAGAHGYLSSEMSDSEYGVRWSNIPGPKLYLSKVEKNGHSLHMREELTLSQAITEYLFLRLRTSEGIKLSDYEARFNESFLSRFKPTVETLSKQNFIEVDELQVRVSSENRLHTDSVISELAAGI